MLSAQIMVLFRRQLRGFHQHTLDMLVSLFAARYARITRYLEKGVPPEGQAPHYWMAGTSPDFHTIYADAVSASTAALTDDCATIFIITSCFILIVSACVFCSPHDQHCSGIEAMGR